MNYWKFLQYIIGVSFLALLINGCNTLLPTSVPPAILGKVTGSKGPITEATISLETFRDESCVKLAESTSGLSDLEKQQLEECSDEVASVTSDTEGRYKFSEIDPGWYKLNITWRLNQKPEFQSGLKDEFFVVVLKLGSEKQYTVLAQGDIFFFSGEEELVIDLDM